jgi:hypothetical protein
MSGNIRLRYLKGIIPQSELVSLKSQFGDLGIDFDYIDASGEPQASIKELLAPIILFLSSDVVQAYILGLATNFSYEIIKKSIINIWGHISGKKVSQITESETHSVAANFDLDINLTEHLRVKFKLKGDFPDSLKKQCVDKAFQLLERKAFPESRKDYVCIYNVHDQEWEVFEELEFIRRFIKPKVG